MREYYGELSNCLEYIENKNHKAIPWKEYPFSFEFYNNTNYTLELKRGKFYHHTFAIVTPKEKIQIQVNKWGGGEIFVSAKEDISLKCNFDIECGCMIERNLVEHINGKVYIAPIFKNGIITIVTCNNCGPNFGVKSKYKISPLKKPAKMIKVCNFTPYDIIISTENTVLQIIEARNGDEKCHSKVIGIPLNGIIYIDTVYEEIAWKDPYNIYEDAIFRVNGCCIKINDGNCSESVSVIGPVLSEPHIRHLHASFVKIFKYEGDVNIWCNTIDYRID